MEYNNLDTLSSFKELQNCDRPTLSDILTEERIKKCNISLGGGLTYNYAAMPVDDKTLETLQKLSDEAELIGKYKEVLKGKRMNSGEDRLVLHHLQRGNVLGEKIVADGEDKETFYREEDERIKEFSNKVRSGKIKGSTGKVFTTICQIGIGGSDLGPRALYIALKGWAKKNVKKTLKAYFISNVDPDDGAETLEEVDPETTLFILVSKSGTTEETLTNKALVEKAIQKKKIPSFDISKHMIAVTSKTSPLVNNPSFLTCFYIDDYIGGRYSSTSAVGSVLLSLAFGFDTVSSLKEGAHEEDVLATEKDIKKNGSLMDALIGVLLRNIYLYPSTAILPYSQALSRFPAHLQQLDMESNGKSVNRYGERLSYPTGPVIFGEPGTNGQHSFYQLLHQGTDIIPLQFIGFKESQRSLDFKDNNKNSSTKKLNANLSAQIVAFAFGKESENLNKKFDGNRPSSLIYGEKLDPSSLGALLSHYENKVMFQGFLWNINSFDQEGVQLGKTLAKEVLKGSGENKVLSSYASLLIE